MVTISDGHSLTARFFRTLLKKLQYSPRVLISERSRSYGVTHRMPGVEHRQSKYLNNRPENSHQPTRQQERAMRRFHSPGGPQRSLSAFSTIAPHLRPGRHTLPAVEYRATMAERFRVWNQAAGLARIVCVMSPRREPLATSTAPRIGKG